MLPFESEAEADIASGLRDEFEAAERLHNAVVAMFDDFSVTSQGTRGLNPAVCYSMPALLAKACKTFRALEHVCARGLGQDANVLLRSLYETVVVVLFILQKRSRERVALYHAHVAESQLKMLQMWKGTPGLKRKATKGMIASVERMRDVWVGQLPAGTDYKRHWSGKGTLKAAVRSLRGDVWYQLFYRYASPFAHATDLTDHLYLDEDPWTVRLGPGDLHVREALLTARMLLWMAASRIDERLRLARSSALEGVRPPGIKPRKARARRLCTSPCGTNPRCRREISATPVLLPAG